MSLRNFILALPLVFALPALGQSTINGQTAHVSTTTTINSNPCLSESTCLIANTSQHISGAEIFLNMLPQFISGTTITDSSGNGNNATLCTGANAPQSTLVGLFFPDNARCAPLPTSVNNLRTFEFVINIPITGSSGSGAEAAVLTPSTSGATNNGPWIFLSAWISSVGGNNWSTTPGLALWKYGADTTTSPVNLSSGNHVVIVTFGTSGSDYDHFYFDGVEVTPYTNRGYSAGTQLSGNWILGACQSCGLNSASIVTEYEFIGWSTELTAAQVAQEYAASSSDIQARGAGSIGVQWNSIGPNWYAYGDSLTYCLYGTVPGDCWVNQPPAPVPTFGLVTNLGNAGKTADYIMSTNAGSAAPNCSSNQGPQIATVFDGTNNFSNYSTATAANVAGYLANQIQLLTQAGCKVFVGTMISRGSSPAPPNGLTWNANQIALDNLIRQNWKAWGAAGILDFAADPYLGCSSCNTNGTYYQSDFVHLQNAGYLLMQADAWNSMEYYFGYNKSNPNAIVQTVAGAVGTAGSIPGSYNNNMPANWAIVVPSPLISGPLSSITLGFNAAPTTTPITLAYATGTAPTFTIVPGSSFTVTPTATSGNQTFVAGVGFTAPLNAVAGEFPVVWVTATGPGLGGGTPLYYLTGQSTLPSGAQTYTAFSGENVGLTMTVTNAPVTTTAYQMLASDGYIELTQASAGETLTLPSCVGQSGAVYTINNQTSQVITLKNLNSTQPINGTDHSTTGLVIPATATAGDFAITDVPNALGSTSGCHWSF